MSALREETVLSAHAQPDPATPGVVMMVRMVRCAEHLVRLPPVENRVNHPCRLAMSD
jgi:hypothetical protein